MATKGKPNSNVRLDLVLLKNVDGLGAAGSLVSVKRGYGRNYLLPQGFAVYASEENVEKYGDGATLEEQAEEQAEDDAAALVRKISNYLESKSISMKRQEGNKWEINPEVLAVQVRKQLGLEVPAERILLGLPIVSYGTHEVPIALSQEAVSFLNVSVARR